MSRKKITQLTALSGAIASADVIAIVDDPAGTPVTKKMTVEDFLRYLPASAAGITLSTSSNGNIDLTPNGTGVVNVNSAGVVITGAESQSAWGATGVQLALAAATHTDTSTAGSGTAALATAASFAQPTLAATNASVTTTDSATVYIAEAPTAGTNQTLTNAYSLLVAAGLTRFNGNVGVGAKATTNLHVGESNTDTDAAILIDQSSTGDAAISFLLNGGQQMIMGIDNSDGDKFIISDSAALGTTNRLVLDTSGNLTVGLDSGTQTNLAVYESNTDTAASVLVEQGSTGDAALSFLLTGGQQMIMGIDNSDSDKFIIADSAALGTTNRLVLDTSGNFTVGLDDGTQTNLAVYESTTDTAAGVLIEQGSTGDAALSFLLTGGQQMIMGIDNSDGDKFIIADSAALGTTNRLVLDTSGNLTVGLDSGTQTNLAVYESNTDTAAGVLIEQGSTGDAAISWLLTGGQQYTMGIDNTNSDALVISRSAALGTTNHMVMTSTGYTGFGLSTPGVRIEASNTFVDTAVGITARYNIISSVTSTAANFIIAQEIDATIAVVATGVTNTGFLCGLQAQVHIATASNLGTTAASYGARLLGGISSCGAGCTITDAYGAFLEIKNDDADGTITNAYGLYITHGTTGTTTNGYGIYVSSSTFKNYLGLGNTGIGVVPTGVSKLQVDQNSTSAAIPVLSLDQGDIDDTFINFIGTSAADGTRSISTDTTEDSAKYGAIRVEINGTTKWIRIYDNES